MGANVSADEGVAGIATSGAGVSRRREVAAVRKEAGDLILMSLLISWKPWLCYEMKVHFFCCHIVKAFRIQSVVTHL